CAWGHRPGRRSSNGCSPRTGDQPREPTNSPADRPRPRGPAPAEPLGERPHTSVTAARVGVGREHRRTAARPEEAAPAAPEATRRVSGRSPPHGGRPPPDMAAPAPLGPPPRRASGATWFFHQTTSLFRRHDNRRNSIQDDRAMTRRTPIATTLLAAILALAPAAQAQEARRIEVPVETIRLENGLTVFLHRDATTPTIATNIWYHVGSSA